ncbi:MAG TPA: hypothetical protein DIC56_11260 [Rhizobium sp.]|nr:hypothetical protein [Rhizobium sp.]
MTFEAQGKLRQGDAFHHDQDEHHHDIHYSDMQALVRTLETLLTERGRIDPATGRGILAAASPARI